MGERLTRKHPLYIGIQVLFFLILLYLVYRLGGPWPAVGLGLFFLSHFIGEIRSFVKVYTGFLLYKTGWRSLKIPYTDLTEVLYVHRVGGREFYKITYRAGKRKKVLKLHSYMFTRLKELFAVLEGKGIPLTKPKKKNDYVALGLFALFAAGGIILLNEVLLRFFSFLRSGIAGRYHLYPDPFLWMVLFVFYALLFYRLFRLIKQKNYPLFFSRIFLHIGLIALLFLFLRDFTAVAHRTEMARVLIDVRYQCEAARFEGRAFPFEKSGCTEYKTKLMKGWKRLPVQIYFVIVPGEEDALLKEPGRIIISGESDYRYLATFWEEGEVKVYKTPEGISPVQL